MWNAFVDELTVSLPTEHEFARITLRLLLAAVCGGILGLERTWTGKEAGLRTHMLVCLGATIFVLVTIPIGTSRDATSRIVQGIATGIGFVGAGTIMKLEDKGRVRGLTTAANIWLTAAIGTTIGVGDFLVPVMGTLVALFTLVAVEQFEQRIETRQKEAKRRKKADKAPDNVPLPTPAA